MVKDLVEPAGSRLFKFRMYCLYESKVIIQFVTDSVRLIGCTSRECVNFVNSVKCVQFILYGSTVKVRFIYVVCVQI